MPIDGRWEKCTINTGEGVPGRTGAISRADSETSEWSRWWAISTTGKRRYASLDKEVSYRVEFRTSVSVSMAGSQIIRTTDGNKIYEPISAIERLGSSGFYSLLVRDTGKVSS